MDSTPFSMAMTNREKRTWATGAMPKGAPVHGDGQQRDIEQAMCKVPG